MRLISDTFGKGMLEGANRVGAYFRHLWEGDVGWG